MTTYKNKELHRYKEKSGGKNQSEVDGFYSNSDGEHFFIKKPADKVELFTELFAGLLLQEFKDRKLIDEIYFPSLICADIIRFDDGSYGLIQPLVSFDELHKVIGTSYKDGSDRDPMKEALYGPSYYTGVTKLGNSFGLSISLMFSLLLGAHSVHSGNMVVLKGDEAKGKQFGRIDWGDAFRYFAHKNNNDNILYAHENRGWFNYKSITKDYFLNFKKINGLYPAMADKAEKLLGQLDEEVLADIVSSALQKIPTDFIDKDTQDKIATYMDMPLFSDVILGNHIKSETDTEESKSETFAEQMGKLLASRLTSISKLQDLQAKKDEENVYASVIYIPPQILSFSGLTSFPEILKSWNDSISPRAELKTDTLDLAQLTGYFNQYIVDLAEKAESTQLWLQEPPTNKDIFTPYHTGNGNQVYGHAFVPQYKESTIIKRFFTINTETFDAFRFAGFEQSINDYSKANPESPWVKIQTLLQAGQQVITTIDVLNRISVVGFDEDATKQVEELKIQLKNFEKAEAEVQALLHTSSALIQEHPNTGSSFFYPIEEQELNKMTGDQLATICLEELNSKDESSLVNRIINNDRLWYRMDDAFETGIYNSRLDGSVEKILQIRGSREQIEAERAKNNRQIVALEEQIATLSQQVADKTENLQNLNGDLSKHMNTIETLQKKIDTLKGEIQTAANKESKKEDLLEKLNRKLQELEEANSRLSTTYATENKTRKQAEESVQNLQLEVDTLRQQITEASRGHSEKESLLAQLKEQLQLLEKTNGDIQSTLAEESKGRKQAEHSVLELKEELERLEPELKRIKTELDDAHHLGTAASKENASKLQKLENEVIAKQALLEQAEEQLQRLNETKQQQQEELSIRQKATTDSIKSLTEALDMQKAQSDEQQKQLDKKDEKILELRQKLERIAVTNKPSDGTTLPSEQKQKEEAEHQLMQKQYKEQISSLLKEKGNNKAEIARLNQLIDANEQAQKRFEEAKREGRDTYFARMERMIPIISQIQGIESKADDLNNRNESEAAQEAYKLANRLRNDIKDYAENPEKNEDKALDSFKMKATETIGKSKDVLSKHRGEWKYILANITLGILLVGVGYAAVALINKQVTGNYTFFSKTDSLMQVEKLQENISSQEIPSALKGS